MLIMLYIVVAAYIVSSGILFVFPTIVHEQKNVKFKSRFMAHRGGGGEKTENTLVAFRAAKKLGVDMFELDVQLTKDGEVMVCHDDSLARVCGVDDCISNCDFSDLPLCLQEIEVACEPGDYHKAEKQEPLLTLEQLYKEFPKTPMQIDVKPGGHELISKVSDLTKKYSREDITVWGAFSHKTTLQCRQYNPHMLLLWHLHRRGIRTGAWVMNHSHEYEIADSYGFNGIMTDYPSRFVNYEKKRLLNAN